jgi:hypothetical protein
MHIEEKMRLSISARWKGAQKQKKKVKILIAIE